MPGTLFDTDTSFPRFTGNETDSEKIQKLQDYLYQLAENFRYLMSNLGIENFNATELEELGTTIRKPVLLDIEKKSQETGEAISKIEANIGKDIKGIKTTVSEVKEGVEKNSSTIEQNAKMLAFVVEKKEIDGETKFVLTPNCLTLSVVDDEKGAKVVLTSNGTEIASDVINLNGFVTFSDLEEEGKTIINGPYIITGSIVAGKIYGGEIHGKLVAKSESGYGPGTISGATFESIYDSDSMTRSGNIVFLDVDNDPGWAAAEIWYDDNGNTEAGDASSRLMIGVLRGGALKLYSEFAGVSVEGATGVYLVSNRLIDLKSDGGKINIGSNYSTESWKKTEIHLRGDVYVNGKLIS